MRWLRSLYVQLFLWAVMPVTLAIIALSFTGVYSHQQTMRDFVVARDTTLARLLARSAEDGLAQGLVGGDGGGLADWMALDRIGLQGVAMVIDPAGRVLAHTQPGRIGAQAGDLPGIPEALTARSGFVIVSGAEGPLLVTFAPVAGTGWTVVLYEPVQELTGPLLRFPSLIPLVGAGAAVLSLLILFFGWWTIVRPLQHLARAAEGVAGGDYGPLLRPVYGAQEVRDLHRALAEMGERIRGYEAGVRDYLGAVTRGQEDERARLALELHDGPVQALIALGQRAEMAGRLIERGQDSEAAVQLEELRQAEQAAIHDLRRLIAGLRPLYLEDLGLVPALEVLVRRLAALTPAEIRLETGSCSRLGPEVELAAYRIAQEALQNAVQHATASRITVHVSCAPDELVLAIADDGQGFDPAGRPDVFTRRGHFGLLGMQERAAQLGGTLRVQSAPGQGTCVTAHLPAHPPAP